MILTDMTQATFDAESGHVRSLTRPSFLLGSGEEQASAVPTFTP